MKMSAQIPVPAPRFNINNENNKKPVPTPRRLVRVTRSDSISSQKSEESGTNTNTFSRRVRSLSHASRQIAEDIGELMQDRKKAVIESTRNSVRRIAKRFNSSPPKNNEEAKSEKNEEIDMDQEVISIFSSISFDSPLKYDDIYANININEDDENIYMNVEDMKVKDEDSSSIDSVGLPPPSHPPPPLPDESIYDAPSSSTPVSSSTSTSISGTSSLNNPHHDINNPQHDIEHSYECVFPNKNQSEGSSSGDSIVAESLVAESIETDSLVADSVDASADDRLSRSESWKFYDTVVSSRVSSQNIYNNVDSTPVLKPSLSNVDNVDNDLYSNPSISVTNSAYENYVLPNTPTNDNRNADSVIFQFDPLQDNQVPQDNENRANDMKMLEQMLQGDLYGNMSTANTIDNWSISDNDIDEFVNPPPPPLRFDSLPEDELSQPSTPKEKSRTSWFITPDSPKATSSDRESRTSKFFKHVRDVLEKAPDVLRGTNNKDAVVQRPEIGPKSFVQKKGMLYKVQGGPVEDLFGEYSGRWCVLENSCLVCYSDNTCDNVKEYFSSDAILSVQILQDPKYKYKYDNNDLHCFELNVTGKNRGGHVYGSRDAAERRKWMQCIAECLTYRFSPKLTSDYTRMGWAYVREGVSGNWVGAWLMLSNRTLHYAIDKHAPKAMDLRKARCIGLQAYLENDNNPRTNDKGPNMLVDLPSGTLYLRMWTMRETKVWTHIVKLAAHNNGAYLDQQQLSLNDIPVIVEKCINFIYAHGSMSQGIYRRSGTGSLVTEILTKFSKDAFEFQLTIDKYTEHDVANALKRFFRDLPEPLLSSNQRQYLYQVSKVNDRDEKVRMYKAALDQLPPISYKTARKLLGHLHFISTQSDKNLMTISNLAAIWGPTLMHFDNKDVNTGSGHQQDVAVVAQLIGLYRYIFPEDVREIEKEKLMLQVLKKYAQSPHGPINSKVSGDFRVWIYLHNKEGQTFNVALGPNKTAYEVCAELSSKVKMLVHELVLEEVVLNDKLVRPVHHSEKVLDVVLSWGYWDEADRKDNHLILAPLSKYWEFIQEKPSPLSSELKFADMKSKHFKVFTFEFSQAKLNCYKDKTCDIKLSSWNIEDIVWYFGHESKRNPQTKWTVTFIEKNKVPNRNKASPYFGNILAWADPTARANWLGAMLRARYPNDLTPPPQHVNLISP